MRVTLGLTMLLPVLITLSVIAWALHPRRHLARSAIAAGIMVGRILGSAAW